MPPISTPLREAGNRIHDVAERRQGRDPSKGRGVGHCDRALPSRGAKDKTQAKGGGIGHHDCAPATQRCRGRDPDKGWGFGHCDLAQRPRGAGDGV